MSKEHKNPPRIPSPTVAEIGSRIASYNTVLEAASKNREELKNKIADLQTDDDAYLDNLIGIGETLKPIEKRTIPVFTQWRQSWIDALSEKEVEVQQLVSAGHLPEATLPRAETVFTRLKKELNIASSYEADNISHQLDQEKNISEREFNRLAYVTRTKYGTSEKVLPLPPEMDEREYTLLVNMVKDHRAETFLSSRLLGRELTEQFGVKDKLPLVHRINRLRRWLGDDPTKPRLIENIGEKSKTEYRFNAQARLLKEDEDNISETDVDTLVGSDYANTTINLIEQPIPIVSDIPEIETPADAQKGEKENPMERRDPQVRQKLRSDLEKVVEQVRITPSTTMQISNGLRLEVGIVNKIVNILKLKPVGRKERYPLYDQVGAMIVEYGRDYDWKKDSFRPNEIEALKHLAIEIFAEWEAEQERLALENPEE